MLSTPEYITDKTLCETLSRLYTSCFAQGVLFSPNLCPQRTTRSKNSTILVPCHFKGYTAKSYLSQKRLDERRVKELSCSISTRGSSSGSRGSRRGRGRARARGRSRRRRRSRRLRLGGRRNWRIGSVLCHAHLQRELIGGKRACAGNQNVENKTSREQFHNKSYTKLKPNDETLLDMYPENLGGEGGGGTSENLFQI